MKRNLIISSLLAAGILITVCATSAPKPKPVSKPAASSGDYVGSEPCIACHVKYTKDWNQIPHNKMLISRGRKPADTGCEACHGPGKTHVTTDRKKIIRFNAHDVTSADAACLRCHGPAIASAEWKSSRHSKFGLGCLTCHDPHRPKVQGKMLRTKNLANCVYCHGPIAQMASEGKHHRLVDGAGCTKCHTPHGSKFGSGLVKAKGDLCKGCHGEGAGKPSSHNAADWKTVHGKTAKSDDSSCKSCHSKEKFCTSCHGFEMPHPDGWMMKHKDHGASLAADSKCFKCHDRKKFCICHGSGS